MLNIAVVGIGSWGKNLARTFFQLPETSLSLCCDTNEELLNQAEINYPGAKTTQNFQDVIDDGHIDAVVIASPAGLHYQLAKQALLAGKHVFVEKPMALNALDAQELVQLSEKHERVLMVGHLLLYHPAVKKLKELISSGEIGQLYYAYAQRVNLGKVRKDENALWSFAPHDISVILYLFDKFPGTIVACGESYLQPGIDDVVFVNMHFPDKRMAQVQVSWLDPRKLRQLTLVGDKKMIVFDDVESTEKIKIYDKGAYSDRNYNSYGDAITLRFGDIYIPRIAMTEPLRLECQHFVDCITQNRVPLTDGKSGLEVVKILEAAQESLNRKGQPVGL